MGRGTPRPGHEPRSRPALLVGLSACAAETRGFPAPAGDGGLTAPAASRDACWRPMHHPDLLLRYRADTSQPAVRQAARGRAPAVGPLLGGPPVAARLLDALITIRGSTGRTSRVEAVAALADSPVPPWNDDGMPRPVAPWGSSKPPSAGRRRGRPYGQDRYQIAPGPWRVCPAVRGPGAAMNPAPIVQER